MIADNLALNQTIEKMKSLIENMKSEITTKVENKKNYVIQLEQGRAEYGLRNQEYQEAVKKYEKEISEQNSIVLLQQEKLKNLEKNLKETDSNNKNYIGVGNSVNDESTLDRVWGDSKAIIQNEEMKKFFMNLFTKFEQLELRFGKLSKNLETQLSLVRAEFNLSLVKSKKLSREPTSKVYAKTSENFIMREQMELMDEIIHLEPNDSNNNQKLGTARNVNVNVKNARKMSNEAELEDHSNIIVKKLITKGNNSAFSVGVSDEITYKKVYDQSFWPEGVLLRELTFSSEFFRNSTTRK
ncbi:hypothetical protein WA026_011766 [Henosepilachna vigintioctopunctata]|uniref:Uncharacterized protein n=1 Tax=Henosepilachna vigintioctopunctata TaxID=420089 RepID=A0AAW1U9Y2_9CUCU